MIIVIDANSIIAALLKDGKAREIIVSGRFTLVSPEYLKDEIYRHIDYISKKSGVPKGELDLLLLRLMSKISLIPHEAYSGEINEAKSLMKTDIKDVPYVACYIALKCDAIWTNDSDFRIKQIKIIKTEDLLKLI